MANAEFNNQAQNPMSEYLLKLQLIVSNTIFKDRAESKKYETTETLVQGDKYVSAVTGKDIFESYTYDSKEVYTYLASKGYSEDKIFFLINIYIDKSISLMLSSIDKTSPAVVI